MTPEARDPLLGALIDGRFEIVERLGEGGMGAVYKAIQTSVDRLIAVKVIRGETDPKVARRFLLEAKLTSSLRSPHTVTLLDFGRDGPRLYLAMELLEGRSLSTQIQRGGKLPWRTALHLVRQVARSLEEAHERGIVHRDLKPANIFICPTAGDPWFVKVLDFGIGKLVGADSSGTSLTDSKGIVGTPAYIAPEQATAKPVDGRADLYSLGCVLYELLTGDRPFRADTAVQVMMMHVSTPPPEIDLPRQELPDEVLTLVDALLQKHPEHRPGSARQVAEWIGRCLGEAGSGAERADVEDETQITTSPPTTWRQTGWLALLALLACGAAMTVWWPSSASEPVGPVAPGPVADPPQGAAAADAQVTDLPDDAVGAVGASDADEATAGPAAPDIAEATGADAETEAAAEPDVGETPAPPTGRRRPGKRGLLGY